MSNSPQKPVKKNNVLVFSILASLVALVVIGGGGYLFLKIGS
jgi:hypothetical protein